MEYTTYRDGGTKSFKLRWLCSYFKDINAKEICLDSRMRGGTNEWYLGHPDKGRKLTQEEIDYIVPEIIKEVEADVKWRTCYLDDLKLKAYDKQ